jgi:hypothetical protein
MHTDFSSDNSEVFDELLFGRSMRVDQILCMDHFLCTTVQIQTADIWFGYVTQNNGLAVSHSNNQINYYRRVGNH